MTYTYRELQRSLNNLSEEELDRPVTLNDPEYMIFLPIIGFDAVKDTNGFWLPVLEVDLEANGIRVRS